MILPKFTEIIESWENSNGPLQVINPIFFPFSFPSLPRRLPSIPCGSFRGCRAMAQRGPAASGTAASTLDSCVKESACTFGGEKPCGRTPAWLGGRCWAWREGAEDASWPPDEDTPSAEGEGCSGNRFSPQLQPQAVRNQVRGYLPCLPASPRLLPCLISRSGDLETAPETRLRSLTPLEGLGWRPESRKKLRNSAPGFRRRTYQQKVRLKRNY